jgi:hypothetical protein
MTWEKGGKVVFDGDADLLLAFVLLRLDEFTKLEFIKVRSLPFPLPIYFSRFINHLTLLFALLCIPNPSRHSPSLTIPPS